MTKTIELQDLSVVTAEEDQALIHDMSDVTEQLIDRHLRSARSWCPSLYVTPHHGRSYAEQPWDGDRDGMMPLAARAALEVNTLTEDNLTSYNHNVLRAVEHADPSGTNPLHVWGHRWTAEEDRHGRAMGLWITAHAATDPVQLDKDRFALMEQVKDGTPEHHSVAELIAYAAFQERATQVSHKNTGMIIGDECAGRMHGGLTMLGVIAGDEARHYRFYRDWTAEAMQRNPSVVMHAVARQLVDFEMPGAGIPNFTRKAALIANSGIYGLPEYRSVIKDVLDKVDVEIDARYLTPQAQLAQMAIRRYVDDLDARLPKILARRAARGVA